MRRVYLSDRVQGVHSARIHHWWYAGFIIQLGVKSILLPVVVWMHNVHYLNL